MLINCKPTDKHPIRCKICNNELTGWRGQIICSVKCKNYYHRHLCYASVQAAIPTKEYMKRNHRILQEQLGKNKTQIKVYRNVLADKKVRFKYHTHTHVNKKGKIYDYVYNLGWMELSDDEILIILKRIWPRIVPRTIVFNVKSAKSW